MPTTKTYHLQQGTDRITVEAYTHLGALAEAYMLTGKDRWSLAPEPSRRCEVCDKAADKLDDDGFCEACSKRDEGRMIAESALEELKSLQRHLEAQVEYFENASDEEITESARRIKRLIEAHDCLEDAGSRSTYGLN